MRNRIAPLALALAFIAVGALFGGYVTKVYIENGGNKLVVASGGTIEVQSSGILDVQDGGLFYAQSIQSESGANKTNLTLGSTGAGLTGPGASPSSMVVGETGLELYSPDGAKTVVIDDTKIQVTGAFQMPVAAAPPVACGAGTKFSSYLDSDVNFPCYCNGTNYVKFTDNSTTTGCS